MRDYLGKKAGHLAIIIAVVSLISLAVLTSYSYKEYPELTHWASIFNLGSFKNIFYSILPIEYFNLAINVFGFIFLLSLLVGGILYHKSNGKKYNLLKFGFLVIAVGIILDYLYFLVNLLNDPSILTINPSFLFGLGFRVFILFICYQLYFYFRTKETIELNHLELSTLTKRSKRVRLLHYLLDLFFALTLSGFSIMWLAKMIGKLGLSYRCLLYTSPSPRDS